MRVHLLLAPRTAGALAALWLAGPGLVRGEVNTEIMTSGEPVARSGTNRWVTPVNQLLTPAGKFVELAGFRPQAVALSPDGRLLVTTGKRSELAVLEPGTGEMRQRVALPAEGKRDDGTLNAERGTRSRKSGEHSTSNIQHPTSNGGNGVVSPHVLEPDAEGQLSYTGLVFSPDGRRLYLANVNGDIKVFEVTRDGTVSGLYSMPLPPANAPRRKNEIPAGLAVSADGRRLYVCGNLSNQLLEFDARTGEVLRTWAVGVAPYEVVLVKGKAYVSNWGGRRPGAGDLTGPAGRGTVVRVDPVRHIASEGSVTVIPLMPGGAASKRGLEGVEIATGLHACALAVTPDQRHVVVANAGSDTLSVIDTRTDAVAETIWARQRPDDLFGAQPNALAFDKTGTRLYVCNGTQNAVAVIAFRPGKSEWLGLIPAGWFPGAIAFDAKRKQLCVANLKGLPTEMMQAKTAPGLGFNTHQYTGSLSLVPVPSKTELAKQTSVALANLRAPLLREGALPPRAGQPPRPVPERVGEPSVFRHVVYIIKENRTYDQVLGDELRGNGDPKLCIFGERVTPNQHKLVRAFVLLDNTYCSGILSADGHQWATTGITTEYLEKSFAGFPRSYPDGGGVDDVDALAYSPAGFIWDNVLAHGKTLRNHGEFMLTHLRWTDAERKGKPGFLDAWQDFTTGSSNIQICSTPGIETLRAHSPTNAIGWEAHVPDVWRARRFIEDLHSCERTSAFPSLTLLYLPNDHTSGTAAGQPTPAASVADNDLALGQVVEALSRSRFWPETVVFAIEDDPQNGWDHVSGYRTTAYVASPYTKRGAVVSTRYNQTSLLRTMELILGLPPMNQIDATATPMSECFTNVADLTPFAAVPNQVPLDELNPEPEKVSDAQLRKDARASARLPLDKPDACPEDALNRILWRALRRAEPYPEWAVRVVGDED
jgi:YVTN family beta-propeller protein